MPRRIENVEMLRAEARFALLCGVILLALGLVVALVFTLIALPPDSNVSPFTGFLFAAPPMVAGWGICHFASWRLERAQRMEEGGPSTQERIQSKVRAMKHWLKQRQDKV